MKLRIVYSLGLFTIVLSLSFLVVQWLAQQANAAISKDTPVLIRSVYYDGYASGDADEAIQIQSNISVTMPIEGWQISDGSSSRAFFPAGYELLPWQTVWIARDGSAFQDHFGFPPDLETVDSSPAIPNMDGKWPRFSNGGDRVVLLDELANYIDVVLFEEVSSPQLGWDDRPLEPYRVNGLFAEEGQILQRKIDPLTNRIIQDTDSTADWIQDSSDPIWGKQVRYPGWDTTTYQQPTSINSNESLTIGVAPDNGFELIVSEINQASESIQIASLTFEHVAIADALVAAAVREVNVTILLEGGPAGGISDQERYVCQQLEAAGGSCWFMVNDPGNDIFDRYRFMHAKYMIIDGARALISTENLSPRSLPDDDKQDGTWGRRGLIVATSDPELVKQLDELFAVDFAPENHLDLVHWSESDTTYGAPPEGFEPMRATGGTTYTVRYEEPLSFEGQVNLTLLQAPDNLLHPERGILARINEASEGDVVRVMQLSERPHWGPTDSNAVADPNVRLEAYIEAARRGATVRILLDSYFDDPTNLLSNSGTCNYVKGIATAENLDLACELGNPAGLGIHNKMILVTNKTEHFAIIGSVNGTELSQKGNREIALEISSVELHEFLAAMFDQDWPKHIYLPMIVNDYLGPANHLLISEVLYNPAGTDDAEFIELVNPLPTAINLAKYSIGDAVLPTDFEDVRIFPDGATIPAGGTIVVAITSTGFESLFNFKPDFEVLESDPLVPNLIDDPNWGDPATFLQLGNSGDEVILRDPAGNVIDVLVYGNGSFPGLPACELVEWPNHSLERFPYWRDRDNCPLDFRDWAFPNPAQLP